MQLNDLTNEFLVEPRRVVGIKRAVKAAAGADHSIVLCSYNLYGAPYSSHSDGKDFHLGTIISSI